MKSYDRIYAIVRQIPPGKVATYGQIADLAELYGQARLIGYALYRVVDSDNVPWHRVINAKGQISQSPHRNGSDDLQRVLLEAEGIPFRANGTIDLNRYRWLPHLPVRLDEP